MSVLSTEAREYLSSCKTDNLYMEIDEAISHYAEREEYISLALRRADSASTRRIYRPSRQGDRAEGAPATLFIRACQRLTADWTCNTSKGVLLIGGDVFRLHPGDRGNHGGDLLVRRLHPDRRQRDLTTG